MKKLQHNGYTIVQSGLNHHVMIGRDGKMVYHAAADHAMSDEELRQRVEDFIALQEKLSGQK